jgi:glutamate---cysteine ligase / carboxylate-amine ligase
MVSRMSIAVPGTASDVSRLAPDPAREWFSWSRGGSRYTIGAEEEVLLLDRDGLGPAQSSDEILGLLSPVLAAHTARETHASVIELTTGVHGGVGEAAAELACLREQLSRELHHLGIAPAAAGMHPLGVGEPSKISGGERYRALSESMRSLARREPTAALHVHVGVPDASDAVRVLCRLRDAAPLLLALSANSPFSAGSDTGFASGRTIVFGAFPRTGLPQPFASYADYVAAVDPLISSRALPDPTFLWWDVRLQPALGTVEVRVMDAQSTVTDSAPLIALVQSLAHLELEGDPRQAPSSQVILEENRFLAARDGLDARLIDPSTGRLVPVPALVRQLVEACRPHAQTLGCADELEHVMRLVSANGAVRQRRWALEDGDLASVLLALVERFAAAQELATPAQTRSY